MNEVQINAEGVIIKGNLVVPQGARGIEIFAHGSGSGRFSPRNKFVAEQLNGLINICDENCFYGRCDVRKIS